jgi:hypothetical protein
MYSVKLSSLSLCTSMIEFSFVTGPAYFNGQHQAVITIPAYFNDARCQAVITISAKVFHMVRMVDPVFLCLAL